MRRIAVCYNLSQTYFSYDYGSIQVYCASSVKITRFPQAISQLFAILHSRILEVIYKPRLGFIGFIIAFRRMQSKSHTKYFLKLRATFITNCC